MEAGRDRAREIHQTWRHRSVFSRAIDSHSTINFIAHIPCIPTDTHTSSHATHTLLPTRFAFSMLTRSCCCRIVHPQSVCPSSTSTHLKGRECVWVWCCEHIDLSVTMTRSYFREFIYDPLKRPNAKETTATMSMRNNSNKTMSMCSNKYESKIKKTVSNFQLAHITHKQILSNKFMSKIHTLCRTVDRKLEKQVELLMRNG